MNKMFYFLSLIVKKVYKGKSSKGKSVDKYSKSDIKIINKTILNKPLRSLDGNTPKEAFIKVFDEDVFNKLF